MANDLVNPNHYAAHKVSPIDLIEAYNLNFALGNTIKYVARHEEKDGTQDLLKGLWYLSRHLQTIGAITESKEIEETPEGKFEIIKIRRKLP